tara:strand:- start:2854 stop:3615 length:762 start_codon:yes stop_codon:yes gene_type:complete
MSSIKAIILAAGQGSRLKNLTKEIPKCMVTIGKKKIIDYQLDALIENNIRDVVIVVGYQKEKLISYIKNNKYSSLMNVLFLDNEIYKKTNSCYSLWVAQDHMKNGYIHLNSDLIFHPDLLRELLGQNSSGMIVDHVRKNEDDMVRGMINNNYITKINKTGNLDHPDCIIVGPIYFSKSDVSYLIDELNKEINNGDITNACYLLFDKILDRINCTPVFSDGLFWKEVDTQDDINFIEKTYEIFFKTHNSAKAEL